MNIYYKIWVDAIIKLRSIPKNVGLWKFYSIAFISMAMALNLIIILFFMNDIGLIRHVYKINFDIFSGTKIDAFISFFISYLFPFLVLNYFLIFHREKYKKLISKYQYHNGKLFLGYFLGSIGILFLYFIVAFFVVKVF